MVLELLRYAIMFWGHVKISGWWKQGQSENVCMTYITSEQALKKYTKPLRMAFWMSDTY